MKYVSFTAKFLKECSVAPAGIYMSFWQSTDVKFVFSFQQCILYPISSPFEFRGGDQRKCISANYLKKKSLFLSYVVYFKND